MSAQRPGIRRDRAGGRSRKRTIHGVIAAVVVWMLAGIPASAPAQFDDGPFAGFGLDAWGSAFTMIYHDPNGPIPANPTGEMHAAYATAQLSDGPSGRGMASVFWPGQTAATGGPFIEDSFWDGVEDGSDGQFPPPQIGRPEVTPRQWPTAAEVSEPAGPHEANVGASHAHSTDSLVFAKSHVGAIAIPGVFRADEGGTTTQSSVGKVKIGENQIDGARSEAVSTIKDITIRGGPVTVKIDAVTTNAVAISDGDTPRISGGTVVAGLTINGQGFTLDHNGLHAGDNPSPITQQLNEQALNALEDAGISMTLAGAIDTTKRAEGSRSAGGLIVRMQSFRFDEMVSQLPDDLEREVRARMSTTHDLTLVFAPANVRASALKAFEFDLDEDSFFDPGGNEIDVSVLGSSLDSGFVGGSTDLGSVGSTAGGAPSQSFVTTRPAFAGPVSVEGVAALTVLLALALVLGAARGLKRLSDTLLAAGADGPRCPLGDDV